MTTRRKKMIAVWAVLTAATVFQTGLTASGCSQFGAQVLASGVDFCSFLNCEPGTFFSWCEPVALLVSCPNVQAAGG